MRFKERWGLFERCGSVVFEFKLPAYDQMTYEMPNDKEEELIPRLTLALKDFTAICKWVDERNKSREHSVALVLVLSQYESFRAKLWASPFQASHPNYLGRSDATAIAGYILKKFQSSTARELQHIDGYIMWDNDQDWIYRLVKYLIKSYGLMYYGLIERST